VSLNPSLVGKGYPARAFTLDADRVARFAAAVGHPGDGVPPTFVTVPELAAGLENVLSDAELGVELSRVLHAAQEYEWGRPFTVGETVTAEARIEDIRSKGDLDFLTLRTELRDEGGRVVVVGRSKLIVRGGA
jgi:hypothetical protein